MTASKQEFDSAAMLLEKVWYANGHLNATERTIDWEAISAAAAQISPSDSEDVLVGAAQSLWTGRPNPSGHYVDALHHLDTKNMELFLRAIRVRAGLA